MPAPKPVNASWATKIGWNEQNDPFIWETTGVRTDIGGPGPGLNQSIKTLIRSLAGDKGQYREAWRIDGNSTTITCEVDWDKRFAFRRHMLGYTSRGSIGLGGGVSRPFLMRYQPEHCPEGEVNDFQYCTHCDLIDSYGFAQAGWQSSAFDNWPRFDRAVFTCTFQGVPFKILPNDAPSILLNGVNPGVDESKRYCYWKRRWNTREQKIPGGGFQIVDDAVEKNRVKISEVGFRPSTEIEWECTWYQIPVEAVPSAAIESVCGFVNGSVFAIDGVNKAVETVLFKGAQEKKYYDAGGSYVSDLTYLFGVRNEGWNKFPDRGGVMQLITANGLSTGSRLYQQAAFASLYKPA